MCGRDLSKQMLIALITLAVLLAAQTVRSWWYRKLWREVVKLNAELLEQNSDLQKSLDGAKCINKILIAQSQKKDGYIEAEEWPEIIEGRGI